MEQITNDNGNTPAEVSAVEAAEPDKTTDKQIQINR